MSFYQVIEKTDYGTDWSLPRASYTVEKFGSRSEAVTVAEKYVTELNVDNALTVADKRSHFEAFLINDKGVFLGILDGKPWYLEDRNGKVVNNRNYYELEGKTEVAVRPMPGT